ncbi:AAA family ATPase [Nocardia sp. NBC_00565]|uniref:UvrD-helicase domain-containing protein n=1 Tax=Nocardia sp. NBC_00565 TaxID=2975993 RepID=UPI002E80E7EE|nr:UvrD-helicase domain-containing protein [Nocardia sp. NBC_00565]WUC00077.1 AAA family ATPase [Nocardia sp. NBC_00565]
MKTQVLIHDLFHKSFAALDGSVRNRVMPFILKMQQEPESAGLDLKQPKAAATKYVRTARVNDQYRAVLLAAGESADPPALYLVAIKKHDEAYEYAQKLTLQVNAKTGAAELFDATALDEAVDQARRKPAVNRATTTLISATVSQSDIERFGVDPTVAAQLKLLTDEDALEQIITALPASQGNAVLDLACGRSPDEVWRDLVVEDPGHIDVDDFAIALQRPLSRLSFSTVDVDTGDELRRMLEGDFAKWRVWLHPLQRKLATHTGWKGPFRVTGGAGTGKTVTAVHRARFLGNRLHSSTQKVLFTTFTKNLALSIESQLKQLAGPNVLRNIDVVNIDALARRVVVATDIGRIAAGTATFVSDNDPRIRDIWSRAALAATRTWDPAFLAEEWSQVVLGHAITTEAGYLRVARSGRSERLSRSQRVDVWQVIEQFERLMGSSALMTFTQLAARATAMVDTDDTLRAQFAYRHAVIDEAQDLHPAHWKLLRTLIPTDTDDLFIVGDAHQRIYGKAIPLSRFDIETKGRSRRLTINYRTSKEILGWCLEVIDKQVDDLDLATETLAGARSVFSGPELDIRGFASEAAELQGITKWIGSRHEEGYALADIAVCAFEHRQVNDIRQALTAEGIPNVEINERTDEENLGDTVRVMTMHRAKGLEFRAVALPQLSAETFPPYYVRKLKGFERQQAEHRLRCVLYVAGSRARERLALSWSGIPSPLLPPRRVADSAISTEFDR